MADHIGRCLIVATETHWLVCDRRGELVGDEGDMCPSPGLWLVTVPECEDEPPTVERVGDLPRLPPADSPGVQTEGRRAD